MINMELDEVVAAQMAEIFSGLGDTSRIRLIAMLAETEMNVTELAEAVGLSHSAVSHHLRHLRQMRLVRTRREGRHIYYLLDDDHIKELFRCGLEHVLHG
jgi:ArsR family transcriptional regulator, lead/cadmium/zinc/bismuth-responsive transcriptional repressor